MDLFFREILEYTYIFNERVIDALLIAIAPPEKSVTLINHTINAQQIWNARIEKKSSPVGVWLIRPLHELKIINFENYQKSLAIVAACNFDEKISYSNSTGKAYENTVRDMMFHAINHSTYHRGQIATDFKLNGIAPLSADYIFYQREQI